MNRVATTETEIQKEIVEFLRAHNCLVFRMNSGRGKGWQQLCPAGTPDLLVIDRMGQVLWIEVKTLEGRLRPEQVEMHDRLIKRGHHVIVARGIDEVTGVVGG